MLVQIEQSLNFMNGSMDYTDASSASIITTFTNFKINMEFVLTSIMKIFRIYGP
jgi:hypothetical protein